VSTLLWTAQDGFLDRQGLWTLKRFCVYSGAVRRISCSIQIETGKGQKADRCQGLVEGGQ